MKLDRGFWDESAVIRDTDRRASVASPASPLTVVPRRRRLTLAACAALLLAVAARPAAAAPKRIGVPKFGGAQEALVRKKVMQILKAHGFELVRSRDMEEGLERSGGSLDAEDGLQKLAKELALAAIVTGDVSGKRAKLVVHDGFDGAVLGDAVFGGANPRKLAAEVGKSFWRKLGGEITRGRVPAGAKKGQKASSPEDNEDATEGGAAAAEESKPKPEAEAPPPETAEPAATPAPNKKPKMEGEAPSGEAAPGINTKLPWLDVEIGGGGLNRKLSYHQNVSTNTLLPYSLAFGPVAVADGVIYPFDRPVGGYLGNLGFEGGIQQGFLISSAVPGGGKYNNVVHDFDGGVRFRFVLGNDATTDLHISATVGEDAFTFTATDRGSLQIPDAIYRYVRPGLGLNLPLGDSGFSVRFGAGYRYITNRGGPQISGPNFFPHLTVAGADAEFQAGYRLSDLIELRVGGELRRYWYNMHSLATDLTAGNGYAAGGAIDQSFTFTATLAFLLGGTNPRAASAGAAEEAAPPPKPKARARKPIMEDATTDDASSGGGSDEGGGHKSGGDSDEP